MFNIVHNKALALKSGLKTANNKYKQTVLKKFFLIDIKRDFVAVFVDIKYRYGMKHNNK